MAAFTDRTLIDREAQISNPEGIRLDIGFDFIETTMQGIQGDGDSCVVSN